MKTKEIDPKELLKPVSNDKVNKVLRRFRNQTSRAWITFNQIHNKFADIPEEVIEEIIKEYPTITTKTFVFTGITQGIITLPRDDGCIVTCFLKTLIQFPEYEIGYMELENRLFIKKKKENIIMHQNYEFFRKN